MATLMIRERGSSAWLFFHFRDGFCVAAHGHDGLGVPVIGGGVGGIEFEAALEFFLSL